MPSGLRLLVIKEIKDLLRDPKILVGIIIFPALLLPLMGAAISVSTGSTIEKAYGNLSIYVVDDDGGPLSQALLDYFGANYVEVKEVSGPPESILGTLSGGGCPPAHPGGLLQQHHRGQLVWGRYVRQLQGLLDGGVHQVGARGPDHKQLQERAGEAARVGGGARD
ncbi:MAG: hypothetical protein ABC578_06060 [Candidatus Methanosuratincola petrocarbonis]